MTFCCSSLNYMLFSLINLLIFQAHSLAVHSLDNYLFYSHIDSIGYHTEFALGSLHSKVNVIASPTDLEI